MRLRQRSIRNNREWHQQKIIIAPISSDNNHHVTSGVTFYFARPYHSWERGSNENANGLVRQYLPKGMSMAGLSQQQCNAIARQLNTRPRKRLGFRTPLECFNES